MHVKLKRLVTSLSAVFLILASLQFPAFAAGGVKDHDDKGSGDGNISNGSKFTWSDNQSGYRFAIVDKNFNQVSNTVDLLFSQPIQLNNLNERYTNTRAQKGLSSDRNNYIFKPFDEIRTGELKNAPPPPTPLRSYRLNGKDIVEAQGEAFKKWFLNGETIRRHTSSGSNIKYSSGAGITLDEVSKVKEFVGIGRGPGGHPLTDDEDPLGGYGGWIDGTNERTKPDEVSGLTKFKGWLKQKFDEGVDAIRDIYIRGQSYKQVGPDNDNLYYTFYNVPNSQVISTEELEQIPLAGSEGWAKEVLNTKIGSSYLFKLENPDPKKDVVDNMIANNYSVIVEPIFWFVPAAYSKGKGVIKPIHPNYVYGTVTNLMEFNEKQGYKFGANGGAYVRLLGDLGWHCMYVGKPWPDAKNAKIKVPEATTGQKSIASLLKMIRAGQGIAMHVYSTSDIEPPTPTPTPPDGGEPKKNENDMIIEQSEISKYLSTKTSQVPNWGPASFTFTYDSMSGSDTHTCSGCKKDKDGKSYCPGHSCSARFGDSAYRYVIENSAPLNNMLEANSAGGVFASKMVNNIKSGSASLGGGSNTLDSPEYQTVIWRGKDVPTIASYKESPSIELRSLLGKYGKVPVGSRGGNGFYTLNFLAKLEPSASLSDLETHSVHSRSGSLWRTSKHIAKPSDISYGGQTLTLTYKGLNDKSVGNETNTSQIQTVTPFGGVTSIHSAGYMAQGSTPIKFYPYIRMTYQTNAGSTKHDVNILSEYMSEIVPNDCAEAAWYNPNEDESLIMSSTQWSLHAKAVNGGESWNGRNQVLPGGAIYQLSTGNSPSRVALVTWQTIMSDPERNELASALPANEYTLAKATTEHKKFVDQAKNILEGLRVVQWVNGDANATNAWTNNGRSVKVTGGGQSLGVLGLGGKTSSETKYHLRGDSPANEANEGDLDIIRSNDSQDTFFKVFADTSGNVYMAKSVGSIEPLKTVNGTNLNDSGAVTVTKILSKNDTVADIDSKLTGDARELNQRTMLITNFVKSLERNMGSDPTASWSPDGKWYNEAWDGIYVVRKATMVDVGFLKPATRSSVLDPKLCPPSSGVRDAFNRAFLSQFKVDSKSTVSIAQNKPNGWIGTFKGKDIILRDMENIYISKKFYIPNVNTQNLN